MLPCTNLEHIDPEKPLSRCWRKSPCLASSSRHVHACHAIRGSCAMRGQVGHDPDIGGRLHVCAGSVDVEQFNRARCSSGHFLWQGSPPVLSCYLQQPATANDSFWPTFRGPYSLFCCNLRGPLPTQDGFGQGPTPHGTFCTLSCTLVATSVHAFCRRKFCKACCLGYPTP